MGKFKSGKIVFTLKWIPGIDNYQGSNCWLCFSMSISLSLAELATEYKPLPDMPLLRVNTEISVFYTPSLCCLRILNYLRILLISLQKY